jgi:hypothetical protein
MTNPTCPTTTTHWSDSLFGGPHAAAPYTT